MIEESGEDSVKVSFFDNFSEVEDLKGGCGTVRIAFTCLHGKPMYRPPYLAV